MDNQTDPTSQLKDVTLICKECGDGFNFSAKEQAFYLKQGFQHVPTRCMKCRKDMREKRDKGKEFYPIKCKITGKVGRIPIEPDDPNDVYSEEVFEQEFAKNGHEIDPLKEPDKTHLLAELEAQKANQSAGEEKTANKKEDLVNQPSA